MSKSVVLQYYSGEQAREIRDTIADVQARGYVDAIATGDPFESTEAFMERFVVYSRNTGFSMVLGIIDDEPVGQAFGWPLATGTPWWTRLVLAPGQPPLEEFIVEDGTRTFALSELMVDKKRHGQGIGGILFRALLADRPEPRVTWMVNPTNTNAYAIYRHWGAERFGNLRPGLKGEPQFDVLLLRNRGRQHR
ncbi:GNAT family N-acetyltransferase [Nocardia goodfellowii]|uniref:Ribosomal protein S18 acetylase RimI-like enzyme n=1 Tax=Nocardia goodfellowii TaxID=882446 RepID=A0ABS4QPK5_9NOCA|nr:GNAT family N-acetyltransferase [Nocardia goodfellowii]MBP2192566.1 ribosomal protein S18 acetylase RimI-like enzyme [Nocardia goodfellowii]